MKILSIKALNINSLKGVTEINFSDLTKDSALFAITGPTGSGKSTILDIISCALYGRTARLKNPNDLMSRHSGEAYCEVEFELKGNRYLDLHFFADNLLNKMYFSNGWIYSAEFTNGTPYIEEGLYPQAGINFTVKASLRF